MYSGLFLISLHFSQWNLHFLFGDFSICEQIIGLIHKAIDWVWRDLPCTKTPYNCPFNCCVLNGASVFHWFRGGYKTFFFLDIMITLVCLFVFPLKWICCSDCCFISHYLNACTVPKELKWLMHICTVEHVIWVKATMFQTALKVWLSGDWESFNWMQPLSHFLI